LCPPEPQVAGLCSEALMLAVVLKGPSIARLRPLLWFAILAAIAVLCLALVFLAAKGLKRGLRRMD